MTLTRQLASVMMSWQRSHSADHSVTSSDDAVSLTPSELQRYGRTQYPDDVAEASAELRDPGTAVSQEPESVVWCCISCKQSQWDWVDGQYRCLICGGTGFYDTTQPVTFQTDDGVWSYLPKSPSSSPVSSSPSNNSQRSPTHLTQPSGPPDSWYWEPDESGERAESEVPTFDPCVTPSGTDSTAGRRRRRRRGTAVAEDDTRPVLPVSAAGQTELLQVMRQLNEKAKKSDTTSNSSWTSRRGPEPGLRWRGGTPPQPPQWKYSNNDLRAFSRWERKIRVWQMQVKNYMSSADSALMLYTNLSGEAELEVEHLQLDRINSKDGVEYILETLRGPLQQKELFQKRKLLADFENVSRMQHENIRQFINRYRRIEKDLEAIGISCGSMYDSESKGNRILERAKLSPELQRLVLIGAGNTLEYEKICESLLLQFPDFKPIPPIFTTYQGGSQSSSSSNNSWRSGGQGKGKGGSASSSTTSTMSSSGSSKFSGKGRFPHKRVFQTELDDNPEDQQEGVDDELHAIEEEDEFQDTYENDQEGEEQVPDNEDDPPALEDTLAEIAEVLTVTSKKLQASVLGRKFSGRKSIEERKKTSSCSACGQMGHWAGDAACSMSGQKGKHSDSGKGYGKKAAGRGTSQSSPNSYGSQSTKKAFVVTMPPVAENEGNDPDIAAPSFFTFMVRDLNSNTNPDSTFEAFIAETIDFAGYMILDTACQRSCCSREWLDVHSKILHNYHMDAKIISACDTFQFGAGPPKTSKQRAYFPVSFFGQDTQGIILGASIVDAKIPFLASRLVLERFGAIIDFSNQRLHLTKIGIDVPLVIKHGHLAVKISCFKTGDSNHESWQRLSLPTLWRQPDPEIMIDDEIHRSSVVPTPHSEQFVPESFATVHVAADQHPTNMVEGMEGSGHQGDAPPIPHLQVDVQDGEVWHDAKGMDDGNGEGDSEKGTIKSGSTIAGMGLHSQQLPPVREQTRQVRSVPPMQSEVPLERRHGRMGGSWSSSVTKFFALASALILNNCPPFTGTGDSHGQRQGEESFEVPDFQSWQPQRYSQTEAYTQEFSDGNSDLGEAWHDRGGLRGCYDRSEPSGLLRLGRSGQVPRLGPSARVLPDRGLLLDHWEVKKGTCIRHHVAPRLMTFDLHQCECPVPKSRIQPMCKMEAEFINGGLKNMEYNWLNQQPQQLSEQWTGRTIFQIRNAANEAPGLLSSTSRRRIRTGVREVLQVRLAEKQMMELHSPPACRRLNTKVDILETFAGEANISRRATSFGMKAAYPVDYNTGFDLAVEQDQKSVDKMIDKFRPLFLIQALDCKDWCLLQDNVNYVRRKILLLMRRRKARKIMNKVIDWSFVQMEQGRYFLIENPMTSRLWQEAYMMKLMKAPGVCVVDCHAGAYGAVNSRGQIIRKGHKWVTNSPVLAARLQRRLTPDQLRQCVPLEGKETTLSQTYCPELVKEILSGVRETAKLHDPQRFDSAHYKVCAVSVRRDYETWQEALALADRTFATTSFRNYTLPTTDPLFILVQQISGWRLERVQISMQPTLMRFPSHVPHTHRGWVLSFTDGSFEAASEDLADTRHPKFRFAKPVRTAIFFFGYAEEDEQPLQEQPVDDPKLLVNVGSGYSFKAGTRFSTEVKTAVIRLHRNMGHPHPSDLKKLLAMNGVRNQQIHDAVESLQCDSCLRTKGPTKPPPAGIPQEGYLQFGDAVQMDVFYVRDIKGQNYMFLGIIDEVTHLRLAFHVPSRNPADISSRFQSCWVRSFGWPLRIKTDPDTAFRPQFESDMNEAGCFIDFVPPESHHKMGLIERHNATMRSLMERVIDSRGASGDEQMDLIAVAASFAKNACTWSSGRPPYIAAFGRIPRMGMDLISDQNGLVAGSTRSEVQHQAALLRAEAQQHLAAMAVDSGFRRALLRKSTNEEILDVPIGAVVAYWRWTAKSSKKKGGYKLARLLGRDPDGKSMWLQAGTNTIKVLPHQVRAARGFEEWNPDYEDIKALRSASDNLQSNFLQDETIPEPSDDDSQPQGVDHPEFLEDTVPTSDVQQLPDLLQQQQVPVPIPPQQQPQPAPQSSQEEAVQTDGYELEEPPSPQHFHLNVSSPTNINIHNQQSFGMTQQQLLQPQVRVPVRKQHKRGTSTPTTPALSQPPTPTAKPRVTPPPLESLPLLPSGQSSIAPSAQQQVVSAASSSRPSRSSLHGTAPPTPSLTPVPEVINLEDPQEQALASVGMSAPSTPPELRLTPAKRTSSQLELELPPPADDKQLSSLMTSTGAMFKFDHNSYQLAGDSSNVSNGLRVWRRLDYDNQVLQTTHLQGPSRNEILHRRVYQLDNGRLLHDSPYQPQQDGSRIADHKTCTLTELWYPDVAQHHYGMIFDDNQQCIRQVPQHFDGTPDLCPQRPCEAFFQIYLNSEKPIFPQEALSSDSESENQTAGPPVTSTEKLSRLQQKALDKEIPWRRIMESPKEVIQAYIEAVQNEEESWKAWSSVKPLSQHEADRIKGDKILRKRILKSRAAFRDKNKGISPIRAKARVVALGHLDPDLFGLARESATPCRQSEYVVMALFTSGCNRMLLSAQSRWKLWAGDVKTAFLQGEPEPRSQPLYMLPPQDGICQAAGVFKAPLYEIVGNIYGLASAPRTWSLHVTRTLLAAGWSQHTLDRMLFYKYNKFPNEPF